jgi:tRNA 2-thiocytidine biosynthesis protein TtcA
MVRDWEGQYPGRTDSMFNAMGHITLSHLMDRNLFPFTAIRPTGVADPAGDKAFDDDDDGCATPSAGSVVQLKLDH